MCEEELRPRRRERADVQTGGAPERRPVLSAVQTELQRRRPGVLGPLPGGLHDVRRALRALRRGLHGHHPRLAHERDHGRCRHHNPEPVDYHRGRAQLGYRARLPQVPRPQRGAPAAPRAATSIQVETKVDETKQILE